jgi:hypothetical protein
MEKWKGHVDKKMKVWNPYSKEAAYSRLAEHNDNKNVTSRPDVAGREGGDGEHILSMLENVGFNDDILCSRSLTVRQDQLGPTLTNNNLFNHGQHLCSWHLVLASLLTCSLGSHTVPQGPKTVQPSSMGANSSIFTGVSMGKSLNCPQCPQLCIRNHNY